MNFGGKVHGGAVMKWVDLAAYACSAGWSGKYCATLVVFDSLRQSMCGSLVESQREDVHAVHIFHASTIGVQANDLKSSTIIQQLTVSLLWLLLMKTVNGKQGAWWMPETPEEDIELRDSAIRLMNIRKQIGEEMELHVKYLK